MATKQQIQKIKIDIERTIQGLRTKSQEFMYQETGGYVGPNTLYSIYYTLSKDEIYLTGIKTTSNSKKIIRLENETLYGKYINVVPVERQPYPKLKPAKPSDSDYRIGEITRYFTQIGNDKSKPIFEISAKDFGNQNSLYRYTEFQWRISGTKEEVARDNQITIYDLELEYKDISKKLFPLQLWKPIRDSYEDVQKKLLLLKRKIIQLQWA